MEKKGNKKLHNASEMLDRKYGKKGTATRDEFDKEAMEYYKKITNDKLDGNKKMH